MLRPLLRALAIHSTSRLLLTYMTLIADSLAVADAVVGKRIIHELLPGSCPECDL